MGIGWGIALAVAAAPASADPVGDSLAALEGPPGRFREVTLHATRSQVVLDDLGWTFTRRDAAPRG